MSHSLHHGGKSSSNKTRGYEVSSVGVISSGISTCIEQIENSSSLNDVLSGNCSPASGYRDKARAKKDVNVLYTNDKDRADIKKSRHPLEETVSLNNNNSVNVVSKGSKRKKKSEFDGNELSAKKFAPAVAEKLWDGSLQLNSSITVSAIASFKSGEKIPDFKWPEFIGVKGKVKLDAFEKYIQDLPRSRSRGLMVISLHCGGRSSKSGLAHMKKVAEGYKNDERVGFAEFSQGIGLYICPHSDTIITILAKHGFFKGRTAVEDNRDSLLGCIVWRRNQVSSSSSVVREFESKNHGLAEQPQHSPSCSSNQRAGDYLPRTQAPKSFQVELMSKGLQSDSDDDDLPEFDFRAASRVSATPASILLNTIMVEKKLPAENKWLLRSLPCSNTNGLGNSGFGRKNMFDNEDDMPEWCPPFANLHRQVVSDNTRYQKVNPDILQLQGPNSLIRSNSGLPLYSFHIKLPVHPDVRDSSRP